MNIQNKYDLIINNFTEKNIEDCLIDSLFIAKEIKDLELETWLLLEINGYHNSNIIPLKEIQNIPNYRYVPADYLDIHNKKIFYDRNTYDFLNAYPVRTGVSVLTEFAKSQSISKQVGIKDPNITNLFKEYMGFDFVMVMIAPSLIKNILSEIKINLLKKLLVIKPKITVTKKGINEKLISKIEALIIKDEIENALLLIKSKHTELNDEVILHLSTLKDIEKKERMSLLTNEDVGVKKSRLKLAILRLIKQL